jgi:hypothetical protein
MVSKNVYNIMALGTISMSLICMAVSYGTLHEIAYNARLVAAPLFPIVIDGTMALAMFTRIYFRKIGKQSNIPVMIMAYFTVTSIILNAIGAQSIIEAYIYTAAPIGVLACTEITAAILEKAPTKKPIKRNASKKVV